MMKHLLSTTAVALALAMPAWAQTDEPTTTTPPPAEEMELQPTTQPEGTAETEPEAAESASPEDVAPAAGTTGPEEAIIPEQAGTQLRAENLMGATVLGPDDERVGVVEDLIFDEQEKITGVVVGVGGFLGIGKKEVGLNWDQAKVVESPDTGTRTILIDMTKADLETAPDFKTKEEREAEERAAAQQREFEQQQLQQQPPTTVPQQ